MVYIFGVFKDKYLSYLKNNYQFNVNNKNTRKRREIGTMLKIKTP